MNYVYLIITIVVLVGFGYVLIRSRGQSESSNIGSSKDQARAEAFVGLSKGAFRSLWRSLKSLRGKGSSENKLSENIRGIEQDLVGEVASGAENAANFGAEETGIEETAALLEVRGGTVSTILTAMVTQVSEIAKASPDETPEQLTQKIQLIGKVFGEESRKLIASEKNTDETCKKLVGSLRDYSKHVRLAIERGYRLEGKIESASNKLQSVNNSILKPARDAISAKKHKLQGMIEEMKLSPNKGVFKDSIAKLKEEISLMERQLSPVQDLLQKIYAERVLVTKGIRVLRGDTQRLLELEAVQETQEKVLKSHEKSIAEKVHSLSAISSVKSDDSVIMVPELTTHISTFFDTFLQTYQETKLFIDEGLIPFFETTGPLIEQTKQMGGHEYYVEVYVQEIIGLYVKLETICQHIASGKTIDKFPDALSGESLKVGYMEKIGQRINQYLETLMRMHTTKLNHLQDNSQRIDGEMVQITEAKKVIIGQLAQFTNKVISHNFGQEKATLGDVKKA